MQLHSVTRYWSYWCSHTTLEDQPHRRIISADTRGYTRIHTFGHKYRVDRRNVRRCMEINGFLINRKLLCRYWLNMSFFFFFSNFPLSCTFPLCSPVHFPSSQCLCASVLTDFVFPEQQVALFLSSSSSFCHFLFLVLILWGRTQRTRGWIEACFG